MKQKILPGSKSCKFSARGKHVVLEFDDVFFRWVDLLEVCRIQTSSAGKE